jgi:O-antigen/teichoic acid export membrane protein
MTSRPAGPAPGTAARVGRNAAWLMAGEVAAKVASTAFFVVVARALGVHEYAWFTFATAFVPLFLTTGQLGIHQVVVGAMVADRAQASAAFSSGLAMRVLTAVIAVVLAALAAPLVLRGQGPLLTVALVGVALALDSVTTYLSTWFDAFGSVRAYATALVVNRIASTTLAAVAWLAGAGLPGILCTYVLGSLAATAYAWRQVRRHFPEVRLSDARRATAVQLVRTGAPLGVAGVLNMALLRLDTVLVAAFLGQVALASYGVAFRFYDSFLFVAFALGEATFARYVMAGRGAAANATLEAALAVSAAAYTPLFVLSIWSAPAIVEVLFGQRYAGAAAAVPWLTLATLMFSATYQLRSATVGTGGRGSIAGVAAAALTVNIALNLVLIPTVGIVGAAAATAAAAAVETVLTAFAAHKRGLRARSVRATAPAALAGAGTALLLHLTGLTGLPAAAIGTLAYLVLLGPATATLPPQLRAHVSARPRALLRRMSASG